MPSCKQITELATSRREGALDDEARRAFDGHLSGCPGCQAYLRQLDLSSQALGALPDPEVPVALRASLLAAFDARQAADEQARARAAARQPAWAALLGVVGAVALLVAGSENLSPALADWAVGAGLAAAAAGLAAVARRLTPGVGAAAVSAALVAAVVRGAPGAGPDLAGLECLAIELGCAGLVAGAGWLATRRTPDPAALGTWAVAGALAGGAALQVGCHGSSHLEHLLAFHVAGVLGVVVAALLLGRRRPARAAGAS